jgi:hypothetical protein
MSPPMCSCRIVRPTVSQNCRRKRKFVLAQPYALSQSPVPGVYRRFLGSTLGAAQGRTRPFAEPTNDGYLREADGWSRRQVVIAGSGRRRFGSAVSRSESDGVVVEDRALSSRSGGEIDLALWEKPWEFNKRHRPCCRRYQCRI